MAKDLLTLIFVAPRWAKPIWRSAALLTALVAALTTAFVHTSYAPVAVFVATFVVIVILQFLATRLLDPASHF